MSWRLWRGEGAVWESERVGSGGASGGSGSGASGPCGCGGAGGWVFKRGIIKFLLRRILL